MTALNWVALPKDTPEPSPGAIVMTGDDVWVHLVAPGRDGWFKVGGGRGPSVLAWHEVHDPNEAAWLAVSSQQLALHEGHRDVCDRCDDGPPP